MSSYVPFDEREVCLNCPRKHCVHEKKRNGVCPIIKEKRADHRREQEEKKRRKP